MRARWFVLSLLLAGAVVSPSGAAATVEIDWVDIGDPGNVCDTQPQGCFGAVAYAFQIAKYEVTNAQYAEFLNAVAATDTYALYYASMGFVGLQGGITRSGSSGSFTYSAIAGREHTPVNHMSFYSAIRFANWLHNGQPTGAQDNTTTEDGAYTITQQGIDTNSITRNGNATIFLPSEDEWYKAAYYDPFSTSYFDYPAGSDTPTTCAAPTAAVNTSNCGACDAGLPCDVTDVGSYSGSASHMAPSTRVATSSSGTIPSSRGIAACGAGPGPSLRVNSQRCTGPLLTVSETTRKSAFA